MNNAHETSTTFREAIEAGAVIENIFTNDAADWDHSVSIIEFKNSHDVYVFDNGGVAFTELDFEDAVEIFSRDSDSEYPDFTIADDMEFTNWDGKVWFEKVGGDTPDPEQTYVDFVEELAAAAQTYDHAKLYADEDKQNAASQILQSAWDRACDFLTATNQSRIQLRSDVERRMGIA